MDIKKYETLLRVIEQGSITRASDTLGCTQSSVSQTINNLETEFGFPVLIRSRTGIRLTPEGEKILPAIRGILSSSEQLNQIVSSIRGLDTGIVRIGTFSSVGVHWLPSMIKEFAEMYPDIELNLMSGDYYDVEQWMKDGSIDLGFIALPSSLNCRTFPLMEDRLLAVLPVGHRLADLDQIPLVELRDETFISLLAASDQDVRRVLESVGIRPKVKYKTKDDYAIISMVENGLGISIMPELLLQGHHSNVVTRPTFPGVQRVIALAVPDSAEFSPAVQAFALHVRKWVSRNCNKEKE